MSILVLARLLSTTPDTLLEYLEDDILGQKTAETEEEELLDRNQAQAIYQEYWWRLTDVGNAVHAHLLERIGRPASKRSRAS